MPLPVISVAQMREWEQATWASGQTESAVIGRVGETLARRAMQLTHAGDLILLLAGKGHNGDDARAMQPHLRERDVHLVNVRDPGGAEPDVCAALARRPALVVDGLFGIGLNRELSSAWQRLIATVNGANIRVLAVDVPSGLNADTGEASSGAMRATETMTVGAPKRGLLSLRAAADVGRLTVAADVGLIQCPFSSELQWMLASDFTGFPPSRPVVSHKGTFGHVAMVAGSRGFHGASVLAAKGAQRARPGLVTVFPQENIYTAVASQLAAPMVQVWHDSVNLDRFSAVLFGPGLAANDLPRSLRDTLRRTWRDFEGPVVVDASALEWLERDALPPASCRVITPHPGEAARLLDLTSADVQRDRVATVRELSRRFGNSWVVLKGHQTLIGRAEGEVFANSSGGPSLAQGGSGDLLAGYITGWLGQPEIQRDPLLAIRYAVWEHGTAADRLDHEHESWIVEELAAELGRPHPSHRENSFL